MALNFDWGLFQQAQERKNQNRQQMNQDIAGIGQGLGQGLGAIGQAMQERKKKAIVDQLVKAIQTQGQPIQGPQGYVPPGAGPSAVPAGQVPPINKSNIAALGIQIDPSSVGNLLPEILKGPQGQKPEFQPVPGMLSKSGKPLIFDKFTGSMREGTIPAKSTGFGTTMGPIRQAQYTIQDLPSNQGPTTAGGAAYQVKVGAKQGKSLIAKPGSPQRTAAAAADLVRSITRVAPTDTALGTANFSNTLVSRWSALKQQLTADPSQVDNPKIRKEMYDIFDEMDKSATPFIANQLDDMADAGFPVTPGTRKRQLGETLPNSPYLESYTTPLSSGTSTGWSVVR